MNRKYRPRRLPLVAPYIVILAIGYGIGYGVRGARLPELRRNDSSEAQVYFSPRGGCTQAIVREIDRATDEVLIQAYSFTSRDIAAAVLRALKRGVPVTAVLDSSNRTDRYSAATFLQHVGAHVYLDDQHAIAHNKVMIIDQHTVITGSFNFSRAAEERNAENLLILRDADIVERYYENFLQHKNHSEPYVDNRSWH